MIDWPAPNLVRTTRLSELNASKIAIGGLVEIEKRSLATVCVGKLAA